MMRRPSAVGSMRLAMGLNSQAEEAPKPITSKMQLVAR